MSRPTLAPPPMPNGGILLRLRHIEAELPPTAKRIADYIVANSADVIRMSITELAEQAQASEGSVIGLCRRLGASGFQEVKVLLAQDLVEPVRRIQEDLNERSSEAEIRDSIFSAHATSLAETRQVLSPESLKRAIELIRSASRVEVYGIGSSVPNAQDLAYRLLQIGLRAHAVVESHVQAVSAAMTDSSVAVVTISHSGSTVETVLSTRLAHEAGARTICITRLGKSPLQRYCDVVLHTAAEETKFRPEAMSSRIAQLAIIDVLVSGVALLNPKQSVSKIEKSMRVIAEKRY